MDSSFPDRNFYIYLKLRYLFSSVMIHAFFCHMYFYFIKLDVCIYIYNIMNI